MNILALDPGKHFAWAASYQKQSYRWGSVFFDGIRSHRQGALLEFLLKDDWLSAFDVVVYETPFARGRDATRSLWGIAGIIEACATKSQAAVLDVAVPTIKKFATGSGKGVKVSMISAAQGMGYTGKDEHEADAFCLLKYAEANLEHVK